jgi:predicted flap endonuclease-1-like 5' DNA nuclease
MSYKIDQIEGVGSHYAELLTKAGIANSDQLLAKCATEQSRLQVATQAGIPAKQLETWYHQADLMRISGVGSEFGQLLERAGVQSVKELADRDPENITHLLHRVNELKRLTRAVPSMKTVSKWISRARVLVGVPENTARYPTFGSDSVAAGVGNSTSGPGRLVKPWS